MIQARGVVVCLCALVFGRGLAQNCVGTQIIWMDGTQAGSGMVPGFVFQGDSQPSSTQVVVDSWVHALQDPRRPEVTSWTGIDTGGYLQRIFTVASNPGGCRYTMAWYDANGVHQGLGYQFASTWGFGWPGVYPPPAGDVNPVNGVPDDANGYYYIERRYWGDLGGVQTLGVYAWIINGIWSREGPQTDAGDGGGGGGGGTPPPLSSDLVVKVLDSATRVPVPNGVTVTLTGANTGQSTTVDGRVFWRVREGGTTITISGLVGGVSYAGSRSISIVAGTSRTETMLVNSNGEVVGGEDTGGGNITSGFFASLFVPSEETMNGLKRSMQDFVDWGPKAWIDDLLASSVDAQVIQTSAVFTTAEESGLPQSFNEITPESLGGLEGYGTVRSLLGVVPFLALAGFLIKYFMPRHTL